MVALFTDETVKKAMEQCQWYPRNQFVLTADLKPKVLKNAIANIAPELRKEDVVAVRDDTFLRSGKVGWILTANKIYFHKDYKLSSDPYHTHFIDFSRVTEIRKKGNNTSIIRLIYDDDTADTLDCFIDSTGEQIYEFFKCIINLSNAGHYNPLNLDIMVTQVGNSTSYLLMNFVFPRYAHYKMLSDLPKNQVTLLKKHLKNPFLEKIVAFDGNIDRNIAYGHLFTTQYYYFFANGKMADHVCLWDLEDVYPHHSEHEMTAIMKDGTVRALQTGKDYYGDFDAIFDELCRIHSHSDVRESYLNESAEEKARRTRVVRKMGQLRHREIPRPYESKSRQTLIELARKLEASGESEELPFIYEQLGFTSPPPEDSYFSAKAWLHMPLSRFALSQVYYYLHCMKRNVRFCEEKVLRYENPDYRAFIEMCNTTPLTEVREKLIKELKTVRSWLEDAKVLNFSTEDIP